MPDDHSSRSDSVMFGTEERGTPPPSRTHDGMCADGRANEAHRLAVLNGDAYKKDSPYKLSGVKELCPLSFCPLFNVVWDMCPDMMHIIPAIMKGHIVPLLKGMRTPAQPKSRKTWSAAANASLQSDWKRTKREIKLWQISAVSVNIRLT
jgi:hypothetical protein